jgi:hypothetical protein
MTTMEQEQQAPESSAAPKAETQALVRYNLNDPNDVSRIFAASGLFPDTRKVSQALVKILAGREFGLGPFAAMRNLFVSKDGKLGVEAHLMAQRIRSGGKYDYFVKELSNERCEIEFYRLKADGTRGDLLGVSTFDQNDAKLGGVGPDHQKGKGTLSKWPRNMLFARAMSNGFRWFVPDAMAVGVIAAPNVYTLEEIGVQATGDGGFTDVMEAEIVEEAGGEVPNEVQPEPQPMPEPAAEPAAGLRVENVVAAKQSKPTDVVKWTLWLVKFSDGREAFTTTPSVANIAKALRESKAIVNLEIERNEDKNRDEIVILEELQPEQR